MYVDDIQIEDYDERFLRYIIFSSFKDISFDPIQSHGLGSHMKVNTRYEELQSELVGRYKVVIDWDANNKRYYQLINLDDINVLSRGGLDSSEFDPRFHQQVIYAVASETIKRFEYALGRSIHWSFARWVVTIQTAIASD
jgi:hypothetical protein